MLWRGGGSWWWEDAAKTKKLWRQWSLEGEVLGGKRKKVGPLSV